MTPTHPGPHLWIAFFLSATPQPPSALLTQGVLMCICGVWALICHRIPIEIRGQLWQVSVLSFHLICDRVSCWLAQKLPDVPRSLPPIPYISLQNPWVTDTRCYIQNSGSRDLNLEVPRAYKASSLSIGPSPPARPLYCGTYSPGRF